MFPLNDIFIKVVLNFKMKQKLVYSTILILIGLMVPILAYCIDWFPESDNLPIWFQRSGSILVMTSVMVEFILLSEHLTMYPGNNTWTDENSKPIIDKYKTPYVLLTGSATFLAFIGTLIWAYGDLFIKYFI